MPRLWKRDARIDAPIQRHLGSGLEASYRKLIGEPVPLDQIELVLALRRVERERRSATMDPGEKP
jgi:hypothetical protein